MITVGNLRPIRTLSVVCGAAVSARCVAKCTSAACRCMRRGRLPSCAAAVVAVVSSLSRVTTVASAQRSGTAYRESLSAPASRERAPTGHSWSGVAPAERHRRQNRPKPLFRQRIGAHERCTYFILRSETTRPYGNCAECSKWLLRDRGRPAQRAERRCTFAAGVPDGRPVHPRP